MASPLATADIVIVTLYVLGTMFLGTWLSRRQRSVRTYFVGDRDVNWWLILISIVATETSTVTFLSVPGVAYDRETGNLTFLQLAFGYVIGRVLIAWLLLPQYLRGDLFSAYQVLRERFSSTVQRTASGLFLVTRTVADGLRLYLAGLLLQVFTGWNSDVSVLVIACATLFYTYLGGMQAVIWTDLIQFVIYILGAILAAVCVLQQIPGGWQEFLAIGQEAGKFTLLDLSIVPTQPYTLWAGIIGGAIFTMASHGADQMMVQRYLCSRSLGQARAALISSGIVVLLQFLLFLLLGVGLYVLYPKGLESATGGLLKNDEMFGYFIVHYLPRGLAGLVIAAVLASAMSTLSSSVNSSASAFVADFYQPVHPGRTDKHYLFVSSSMTLVWGAARMLVALAALRLLSNRSVINPVLGVAGFMSGMVLGLFLLGRMHRPVSSRAALVGLVAGFLAVTAVWLPSTWEQPLLAWPWYAPVGTITTVAVALAVNALGPGHGQANDGGPQSSLDQPR
jgi:SSS family transporter